MEFSGVVEKVVVYAPVVIAVAGAITAATPTPKDDKALNAVRKVLDILALNVRHAKNKEGK